jgi:hypothetical protein
MKTIHMINTWAVAINILLFTVPCFGMLAMIPLGALQLLLASITTITFYRKLDKKGSLLIQRYWLLVFVDFVLIAITYASDHFINDIYIIPLFLLPGFIACYFVYTTYFITKHFNHQP